MFQTVSLRTTTIKTVRTPNLLRKFCIGLAPRRRIKEQKKKE